MRDERASSPPRARAPTDNRVMATIASIKVKPRWEA